MSDQVLELFAGPGGWSTALQAAGITSVGVEISPTACTTARRAGHIRHTADVRTVNGDRQWRGIIASPPCQPFSTAGKGHGRDVLDRLIDAVEKVAAGTPIAEAYTPPESVYDWDDDAALFGVVGPRHDARATLVLEPLRLILEARPEWVALEQVPSVLPLWDAYAMALTDLGYHAVSGVLSAEAYGVPQVRRRAVMLAHRARAVQLPPRTHSRYHSTAPEYTDPGVLPWVSMADALGWDPADIMGFPRLADDADAVTINGTDYRARDLFPATAPAPTVTGKSRSWTRFPRVNDQSGTDRDPWWPWKRPATTVAGRDLIADPGTNANRFNGSTKSRNDGVRVTTSEAGVLQSFPADYPWTGTRSQQHQQIGDAMPPLLAAACLEVLTS